MPLSIARYLPRANAYVRSSLVPRLTPLRHASTVASVLPDDIYDVVVVGGGVVGLALTAGLRIFFIDND